MWSNEPDPFAAAWQRVLMGERHLPSGFVDERSIADVVPTELAGLRECHFFAGIGVWPLALRLAGWPFDRVTWTGSCPCQPFSPAGKGKGFADERHLWPLWFHLIEHCEPECILGEQVGDAGGRAWLDLVLADLEGLGYTCGAVVAPAAGFGAPHIRSRLYWVACGVGGLADMHSEGRGPRREVRPVRPEHDPQHGGANGGLADADLGAGGQGCVLDGRRNPRGDAVEGAGPRGGSGSFARPGPTNGLWQPADWLLCRDEKWRPVEPGTFPLADAGTVRNRMGTLRGAGNALALAQAVAFVESVMEVLAA